MQPFVLKYHRPGAAIPPGSFFLMARGPQTGRPAVVPNANCFVFSCAPQDIAGYYWLVYAIWFTRGFVPLLKGTIIEFARVNDMREIIARKAHRIPDIERKLNALEKLNHLENKAKKQMALILQARKSLLQIE